jgi:hypothetical protein
MRRLKRCLKGMRLGGFLTLGLLLERFVFARRIGFFLCAFGFILPFEGKPRLTLMKGATVAQPYSYPGHDNGW